MAASVAILGQFKLFVNDEQITGERILRFICKYFLKIVSKQANMFLLIIVSVCDTIVLGRTFSVNHKKNYYR